MKKIIDILQEAFSDPFSFSIIFLVYVILASVILPIPVEIGLFNPYIHPIILVLILAVGKGIGSLVVFSVGSQLRKMLDRFTVGEGLTQKILFYCEKFVRRYGQIGLFIIMSIPLMVDSISLYLFSILNPHGEKAAFARSRFVLINVGAGAVRGSIIIVVAYFLGVRLV